MPQGWCGWNEAEGGVLLESPWEWSRKCIQEVGVWCGKGVREEWDSMTGANEVCACQELQSPAMASQPPVPWITSHEEDPLRGGSFLLLPALLNSSPAWCSSCLPSFSAVLAIVFSQMHLLCWVPSWSHSDLSCWRTAAQEGKKWEQKPRSVLHF